MVSGKGLSGALVAGALLSLVACSPATSESERTGSDAQALSTWVQSGTITGSNGAAPQIAVSGDTALILDGDGVSTYRHQVSGWVLQSGSAAVGNCPWLNEPANTKPGVAISGDTALLSRTDEPGHYGPCVYVRSGSDFIRIGALEAADDTEMLSDRYAISGDTIFIASSAGIAVYERQAGAFARTQTLQIGDGPTGGEALWLNGNDAVVQSGTSLHVFARGALGWLEVGDTQGTPIAKTAALTEQGLLVQTAANTEIYVQAGGRWVLDGTVPSRGVMDAGNDVAIVDSVVYERLNGTWQQTSDLNPERRDHLMPPFRRPVTSVAVWQGGILLALNGSYMYDGLSFREPAEIKAFDRYREPDTCSDDGDCKSAHCVEGVCCQTACSGPCVSCLASRKGGGVDGVCDFVTAGTDPRDSCEGGYLCARGQCGTGCGQDADCDTADDYVCSEGHCQKTNVMEPNGGGTGGSAAGESSTPEGGEPITSAGAGARAPDEPGAMGGAEPHKPTGGTSQAMGGAGGATAPASRVHAGGGGGCALSPSPAGSFGWLVCAAVLAGKWRRTRREEPARRSPGRRTVRPLK